MGQKGKAYEKKTFQILWTKKSVIYKETFKHMMTDICICFIFVCVKFKTVS